MIMNSTGIAMHTIHAPRVNLVASTIISTVPVITNPMPLTTLRWTYERRTVGSSSVRSSRVQCRIIPS